MSERALLWGIDGDLHGNEERLMARLPILRFEEDGRLAVARTQQWSRAAERTLTWLADEDEAQAMGTRLDLPAPEWIESGQIVAVFGLRYTVDAPVVFPEDPNQIPHHEQRRYFLFMLTAHRDPIVELMSPEAYAAAAAALAERAKRAFDSHVRSVGGEHVPPEAEAALRVLRGTPGARLDDQIVRQLVVARIQRDADRYRRALELGALRLHETPAAIEHWVEQMLESLAPARPTSGLTPDEIQALRRLLARQARSA